MPRERLAKWLVLGSFLLVAGCQAPAGSDGAGGAGGGGALRKNAVIVTPLATSNNRLLPPDFLESLKVRTGLRSVTSSVLHKFGTSPGYPDWRSWLLSKSFDEFRMIRDLKVWPRLNFDESPTSEIMSTAISRIMGATWFRRG